jgi:hypothetical protein
LKQNKVSWRLGPDRAWIVPVLAVIGILIYEKRWFLSPVPVGCHRGEVMKRDSGFLSAAILGSVGVLGFILAFAGTVRANGEEFFAAAGSGKIDLVYFGRIRDKRTGRSVVDEAIFLIKDKATGLSFPFTNDKPGHYRSPDVGTAIKEIGEKVDVNAFEVELQVAGYKKATVTRVPRKTHGTVELDFALEPLAPSTGSAAGVDRTEGGNHTRTVLIGSLALFLIIIGIIGARTSGRWRSAGD